MSLANGADRRSREPCVMHAPPFARRRSRAKQEPRRCARRVAARGARAAQARAANRIGGREIPPAMLVASAATLRAATFGSSSGVEQRVDRREAHVEIREPIETRFQRLAREEALQTLDDRTLMRPGAARAELDEILAAERREHPFDELQLLAGECKLLAVGRVVETIKRAAAGGALVLRIRSGDARRTRARGCSAAPRAARRASRSRRGRRPRCAGASTARSARRSARAARPRCRR